MFFSNEILTKKGGQFAVVWLVGNFNTVHGSKRLGLKKSDYVSVDVVKACGDMLNPRTQFALRLSSTLLMGIIRIYEKQITIVYDEVKSMWIFLKKGSFMRPENVELPMQRSETFALPNPLYHYDKEMGNEQSDIRFYTSLGEKALFEGHKETHESRADSAYFTISFGDQEVTSTEYENTLMCIAEESPAKRRKISKDSFLDIIEDPHTPLKIKEKAKVMPIEVPGEQDFEAEIENQLLNISEEQLNEKFAECSQLHTSDSGLLGEITGMQMEDNTTMLSDYPIDDLSANVENPLLGLQGAVENQDQMLEPEDQVTDHVISVQQDDVTDHVISVQQDDVTDHVISVQQDDIQDMILNELSSRIQSDPYMQEMNKENEPPILDYTNKENKPPDNKEDTGENVDNVDKENIENAENVDNVDKENIENAENVENVDKENVENAENVDKENDQTLVDEEDPDKENRDPNAAPRRSQRASKKPLRLAQEKAFDKTNSFVLPDLPTPQDAPTKRKRKRQLIVDKTSQLTVKEMKKFMKNSRQHLCVDPVLVHKIRPDPEELFAEPHRGFLKDVPELLGLWKKCAHSGNHDLTELLERQEEMNSELSRDEDGTTAAESSRKRPRSSVLSDVELGRLGGNSTLQDISELEGDLTRLDSTGRSSDNFTAGIFRTSTVIKPTRGSDNMLGPMLSPIQQLENFEESDIRLDPKDLLPIMEEPSIQEANLSDLPALPEMPQISDIPDQSSDLFEYSTMFGQETGNPETTDRPLTPVVEERPQTPVIDEEMRALTPERPPTPLIERLSGVPQHPEDTVAESMSTFRYFPHRESQKFYRFVERKFSDNKDTITFEDLVPFTHTRKTAALAFYQLLLLKKYNHVKVSQKEDEYFGEISIKVEH